MEADECPHGIDLSISRCSLCRQADERKLGRRPLPPRPGVVKVEAVFDSRCPDCGGNIYAGEEIFKPDGADYFVCESCLRDL